jgi:hypothetical protein
MGADKTDVGAFKLCLSLRTAIGKIDHGIKLMEGENSWQTLPDFTGYKVDENR